MPTKPPKLPPLGFAGFEDSAAAGGGRRRGRRWQLFPVKDPGADQDADVSRWANEAELMAGLGRRKEE
jgi:hypothetical protein